MYKHALVFLIILLAVDGVAAVNEQMTKSDGVVVSAKWGFNAEDSTGALQAAVNSGTKKIVVSNMGKPWVVRPITLASDQEIVFEKGVEVVAKRGEFRGTNDCLFRADGKKNIALTGYGATLRMHRSDYARPPYEKAEWRHVLSFRSCSNIKVKGLTLAESGGDGIYLGTATKGVTNKGVLIKDVICDKNYRQGISVITAEHLLIENTVMRNTRGTPPQAGIDFEPNHADERLVNVVMRNCTTQGNAGDGYALYLPPLDASSRPVSIRIEKCRSMGEKSSGVRIFTGNTRDKAVKGKIEFMNCTFERSGDSGVMITDVPVGGCKIRFTKCSIINPTETPIMFQHRRGATEPIGGLEFIECTIRDSHDRNPMGCLNGADGPPVQAITGSLTVNDRRIQITPDLIAEWMQRS
ncbi:MAG TPA: right-handed parallel beta-helix repeat-containing protein [Armatimonadota bacterium]|nr:right-handed parallel beta-helix repeat-containing protein [Armatimonadota bacterium]